MILSSTSTAEACTRRSLDGVNRTLHATCCVTQLRYMYKGQPSSGGVCPAQHASHHIKLSSNALLVQSDFSNGKLCFVSPR